MKRRTEDHLNAGGAVYRVVLARDGESRLHRPEFYSGQGARVSAAILKGAGVRVNSVVKIMLKPGVKP
jgi:hypothetical protein